MGFNVITGNYAANKALAILRGSGAVGSVEQPRRVILPEQVVQLVDDLCAVSFASHLKAGETYNVVWNGVSYATVAQVIGEGKIVLLNDTCPVVVLYHEDSSTGVVAANDSGTVTAGTIEVYAPEIIHPIDPKYLPGVCLPVVEFSTTVASGATFTDAENAALSEAFNTKLPFVVRTNLSIGGITVEDAVAVSQCGTMEGIGIIALVFGTSAFQLMELDGAWVVS